MVTSPMSPPPLDQDQVAALRPAWTGQGLTVRPFTWRDARAPWPGPLHSDRSKVTDPESAGPRLTAADGREARLVIRRGGWADAGLLAGGTVTTRNPDLDDPAGCAALASSIAGDLTAPPLHWGPDLRPVTIARVDDWQDRPAEGIATHQDRDCWYRAISGTEADEWTSPRRCRLFDLTPGERDHLRARHRRREQHAGRNNCHHPGAPGPALKPGAEASHDPDHRPAQAGGLTGEFTAPLPRRTQRDIPAGPDRPEDAQ
jgi:hypothetical protein